VSVFLTCPFSHASAACYRELSVWDFATLIVLLHATPLCSIHVLSRFAPVRPLAHDGCAAPIARCVSHNLCRLPQWLFVPIWVSIGPAVWAPTLDMQCSCTHTHTRAPARAQAHTHSRFYKLNKFPKEGNFNNLQTFKNLALFINYN
jgi:hypothetical protein